MPLNLRHIYNKANAHVEVYGGGHSNKRVAVPTHEQSGFWNEWLKKEADEETFIMVEIAGKSWGVKLHDGSGSMEINGINNLIRDEQIHVDGNKDFNVIIERHDRNILIVFVCIGGNFHGDYPAQGLNFLLGSI
jgi:ribosomal protein L25 (general stress protein Ctc)